MEKVVRAFPVTSKDALLAFAAATDEYTSKDKAILVQELGFRLESWYYQEIDGKPYVIAVAEGEKLEKGFQEWGRSLDPFAVWFRTQVKELTGYDLSETPKGPQSELVYEFRA